MLVKANVSFAGTTFNMARNEVKECNDPVVLQDLLSCGYVEEVKQNPKEAIPKGGKANESKRNTGK
jgi:hypothetical protein